MKKFSGTKKNYWFFLSFEGQSKLKHWSGVTDQQSLSNYEIYEIINKECKLKNNELWADYQKCGLTICEHSESREEGDCAGHAGRLLAHLLSLQHRGVWRLQHKTSHWDHTPKRIITLV